MFRNALKTEKDPVKKAHILNNLAIASWNHLKELNKEDSIPEMTEEKASALKDKEYIVTWFREAIFLLEKQFIENSPNFAQKKVQRKAMDALNELTFDTDFIIPPNFSSETEQEYFNCLNSVNSGTVISNLSEFLFERSSGFLGGEKP
mmetsp:Transcript_5565/g.9545  ORF Transcript_5565/g.9545 Transcript_5565/m.9545 type:complete len:148 (+) Transcript_5565:776-1219(+)